MFARAGLPQKRKLSSPGWPNGHLQHAPEVLRAICRIGLTGTFATGRGAATTLLPLPWRRIGEGRAGRPRRCALPTTAFLVMPISLPISEVVRPSLH